MGFQSWSLVMLAAFCCCASARRGIEPECTRFEYDVQLLERMVRFEHIIELMEDRLKNCLQGWNAKETKLISEIKTLSESLKTEQETKLQILDTMSESLKTEQEAKLQSLEKTQSKVLADTKKEMNIYVNQTIDSINGQWKRPSVYFHYWGIKTEFLSSGDAMRFQYKKQDTHNAYDTTTGCFTVPVQGVYTFGLQLRMEPRKTIRVEIHVNGSVYTYSYLYKSADKTTNMDIAILFSSRDTVCVKAGSKTDSGDLLDSTGLYADFFYGTLVG